MKKIIVFTGAGISAESGLNTFRDNNGLWENYSIEEIATPEVWKKNFKLVLDFYNMRRKEVIKASPNVAHEALKKLEEKYHVEIITQNIDDLHERANSTSILHLHGEIVKSRSTINESKKYPINGSKILAGDTCEYGEQLRPDVVWFGEDVPNMLKVPSICEQADILIIIGTSLNVYPAANIINYVPETCDKYLIDPKNVYTKNIKNLTIIKKKATIGVLDLVNELLKK